PGGGAAHPSRGRSRGEPRGATRSQRRTARAVEARALTLHRAPHSGTSLARLVSEPPPGTAFRKKEPCAVHQHTVESGEEMLERPNQVLVIDDDEAAREILVERLGASDYLVKPIEPEELKEAIERCAASRPPPVEEPQAAPIIPAVRPMDPPPVAPPSRVDASRRGVPTEYVASSPAMLSIWDMVDRVAETDVPVLIRGESGVGKEGIARTVHERSPRRGKPFVKINCAALPSELLESELFGHERGAFTGATSEKPGKFELADKGTIFLDEIGEMHPALQAKLLQVLQDEEYYRVGGKRALRADARVVVATNRVLEDEIARGNFRE